MLKIYTISSNQETKEAESWLYSHKIKFVEIDILSQVISSEEILQIISLTENGLEEIISRETRAFSRLNIDLNYLMLEEFMELIEENATLLKVPLILDEKQLQVGFDKEKMQKFLEKPTVKINNLESQETQTG
ncbi:Spx/MgsR family RNA polymerase-binding regulatory protein [Lactococcus garvieae]|jgi:regulatory protein spx|uniref:Uncharacterized protein n=1 Tax=Lactococcus garvieae DCC43 TaxID=1231377 RepID=K2PWM6_9LACT|nr:Spx/MgsR family RNA polymerase-binding regulatory protein [Lactococcus garvieae]EKF51856.1 hypothetical protein C426_0718 [Lactococcus garvieae DCC43]QPS71225.1 Spx/MgsR family RNA polymerase-binding regulatory protein [Lactococcus garvieae]